MKERQRARLEIVRELSKPEPDKDPLCVVDERLCEWGEWARRNGHAGPVWPERTLLGRMIDEGWGAVQNKQTPTDPNPKAEECDQAITRLNGIRKKVIKVAYLTHQRYSTDIQRRKLNMSRHKWYTLLRESKVIVGAALGYEV